MGREITKIDIPEDLQQICKDFAEVAIKHKLFEFSGKFQPRTDWSGDISFSWKAGRHNEDSNEISIMSNFYVHTTIKD